MALFSGGSESCVCSRHLGAAPSWPPTQRRSAWPGSLVAGPLSTEPARRSSAGACELCPVAADGGPASRPDSCAFPNTSSPTLAETEEEVPGDAERPSSGSACGGDDASDSGASPLAPAPALLLPRSSQESATGSSSCAQEARGLDLDCTTTPARPLLPVSPAHTSAAACPGAPEKRRSSVQLSERRLRKLTRLLDFSSF